MQLLIDDPPEIKIVLRWKMMKMLERSRSSDVSNFSVRNSGDKLCSLRTTGIMWNVQPTGPKNFEKKTLGQGTPWFSAPCCTLLHLAGWELRSFPTMIGVIQPFQPQQTVDTKYMKDMKDSTKDQCNRMYLLCEQFFLLFLCVAFWFKTHFRPGNATCSDCSHGTARSKRHTVSLRFQSVSWTCGILWYPVVSGILCNLAGSADSFSKAHQYRQMWLGLGQLDQFGVALDGCMFCLMLVFASFLDSTVETVWISSNLTKPSWSSCKDYIGLFISRVGTPYCHDVTRLGSIRDSRIQQEQQQHAALPCTLQLTLGWDSDGTCMVYQYININNYIYISMFIT